MSLSSSEVICLTEFFESELLPKIYGFCRLKMNTAEDAEDLSQEICLEVLKVIHAGKPVANWNAFLWSVSNHMFYNWMRRKKHGTTAYMADCTASFSDVEAEYISAEEKALLHRELSMMSGNYRKAVILHYFENKSCEEIGAVLGKSAGTVKWWLHDARKVLEKGMQTMRDYGEKSYRPGTLQLSCQGTPGENYEPMRCAERKSAQNILLAAYKQPLTIQELCIELGIAAPYVEDEVNFLLQNQLMRETAKGKYQTDFVILPGANAAMGNKIYAAAFPEYFEKLIAFLEENKTLLTSQKYNIAEFSWGRLLWVYVHIFTDLAIGKFKYENGIHVKFRDMPMRPNGGRWIALGFEGDLACGEKQAFKNYHGYDGPVHKTEQAFAQGFFHAWSGLDSSVFFDTPDAVLALCRDMIKGNADIQTLGEEQKYLFSIALEKKLFVKADGGFRANYYYVNRSERQGIERLADTFYATAAPFFQTAYDLVLEEYADSVPKHLRWQMGNFLSNHLNMFVTCSLYEAVNRGILSAPDENNKAWLSLFASE